MIFGTYVLDAYRREEAREVLDALETLVGPESGSAWATGGLYVFWNFETRLPLYVGLASDLPVRFGQHNRLKGCPAAGCKREQIEAYFDQHDTLGYTILPVSSLSQPDAARQREALNLDNRELVELHQALAADAIDEIRAVEGALIAANKARFGTLPPWNSSPGRVPSVTVDPNDAALALACGYIDCLMQARRPLRQLVQDPEAMMFEEQLHGLRIMMHGDFRNDIFRQRLKDWWIVGEFADLILASGYLEGRNPLTVGPIAEPPGH